MTKIEMLKSIAEKYELTEDEKTFIAHEIELIAKRNARKSTKPTKAQIANIAVKESLATALGEATEPLTAKAVGELVAISPQKASALLKQMIESGEVVKEVVKGKSLFRL
ncbi:MAG: hypothetical protein IIU11_07830, partial [Bacteroidales bacterium]|nr:hypothetical protein [Bacteroidales bacterium]